MQKDFTCTFIFKVSSQIAVAKANLDGNSWILMISVLMISYDLRENNFCFEQISKVPTNSQVFSHLFEKLLIKLLPLNFNYPTFTKWLKFIGFSQIYKPALSGSF